MKIYDSRFFHPSTMLICGPSGSGKTSFTLNLLEWGNMIFNPHKPAFVILIYETWQSCYDVMLEKQLINQYNAILYPYYEPYYNCQIKLI